MSPNLGDFLEAAAKSFGVDLNLRTGTALDILDAPKPRREFNPGPSSTSRKKRTQIGARGLPHKRAAKESWLDVPTRVKKAKAKKRARQAIGARGTKTNPRHGHPKSKPRANSDAGNDVRTQ